MNRTLTAVATVLTLAGTSACASRSLNVARLEEPVARESGDVTAHSPRPYENWSRHTKGQIGEDVHGVPLDQGILFSSNRHGLEFKLYLREFAGNRVRRVTSGPGHDKYPDVAPDGGTIAFSSTRDGNWQIYVQRGFEDRQPTLISDPGVDARTPSWSPTGDRIAYSRRNPVTGQWEVWIYDVASNGHRPLTTGLSPSFSPDGERIAFQRPRARDENWFSIWTIRLDGTYEQEIVAGREWGCVNPHWSPDGRRIVFNNVYEARTQGVDTDGSDIYAVLADGTDLRQLTFADGPEWNPRWGQDGRIYFDATRDGETSIWSIAPPFE